MAGDKKARENEKLPALVSNRVLVDMAAARMGDSGLQAPRLRKHLVNDPDLKEKEAFSADPEPAMMVSVPGQQQV